MNSITLLITVSHRKYLQEAFLSVKNQVYKDFDFLVMVDVHNDKELYGYVVALIDHIFADETISIYVEKIEGNGTAACVRNKGFEFAETEWVTYLDDDDIITPDALLEVSEAILQNGEGFYASGYFLFDDKGRKVNVKQSIIREPDRGLYYGFPHSVNRRTITSQFQAIKKSQWKKYKYVEDMGEDLDFVMHHLLLSKFFTIPKYLYGYRQRANSYSRQSKIDIMTRRMENSYYYSLFKENLNNEYVKYNFFRNKQSDEQLEL